MGSDALSEAITVIFLVPILRYRFELHLQCRCTQSNMSTLRKSVKVRCSVSWTRIYEFRSTFQLEL